MSTLQSLLLYKLSKEIEENLQNQLAITGDLVAKGYTKTQDYLLLTIEIKSQMIEMDQTWQNYRTGLLQLYSLCGLRDTQTVILDTVELKRTAIKPGSDFLTQYDLDSLSAASQQRAFETKYLPQVKHIFQCRIECGGIKRYSAEIRVERRFEFVASHLGR